MVTIKQLRDHYVAMGGNPDDVDNMELNPQTVQFLSTFYRVSNGESEGSGLPEVTDEDNGMGLIVKEGAWNKGALPIGLPTVTASDNNKSPRVVNGEWAVDSDTFVATFTPDAQMTSVTCDKTFAEIVDAYRAGKQVVGHLIMNASGSYGIAPMTAIGKTDGEISDVAFANTGLNQGVIMSVLITYIATGPFITMVTLTPDA